MELYGKKYSVNALRRRVGGMDQIAGIRMVSLEDGNERPGRAALIKTGSGLEITVLTDRGMDIAAASHCGRAMGWRSTTGDVAPQYFEPEGIRWLRSYFGGLLTTCGLSRVGAPGPESALRGDGLHGRINHTAAKNLCIRQAWEGQAYVMRLTGTMRETSVFGENLALTRVIIAALGENRFWIHDVVVNEGFNAVPLMILYHCNIGWPALDEGARMLAPSRVVAARDEEALDGRDRWHLMDAPTRGYREKCYYHDMQPDRRGEVTVAMVNDGFKKDCGFGVYVKYVKQELPRFVQWKMMGEQDYVCGFEPCNCGVEGRELDAKHGLLQLLRPGERREFHLEFGVVGCNEHLAALEQGARSATPQYVDSYLDFVKKGR